MSHNFTFLFHTANIQNINQRGRSKSKTLRVAGEAGQDALSGAEKSVPARIASRPGYRFAP
jgi:hypothetical protein